jgi:hypothetical protein
MNSLAVTVSNVTLDGRHEFGIGDEHTVEPLSISGGDDRVIPAPGPGVTTTELVPITLKSNNPSGRIPLMVLMRVGVHESEITVEQTSPLISTQFSLTGPPGHDSALISIHDGSNSDEHMVELLRISGGEDRVIPAPGPGVTTTELEPIISKSNTPSGKIPLMVLIRVGIHVSSMGPPRHVSNEISIHAEDNGFVHVVDPFRGSVESVILFPATSLIILNPPPLTSKLRSLFRGSPEMPLMDTSGRHVFGNAAAHMVLLFKGPNSNPIS